jgi:hypothetical protein
LEGYCACTAIATTAIVSCTQQKQQVSSNLFFQLLQLDATCYYITLRPYPTNNKTEAIIVTIIITAAATETALLLLLLQQSDVVGSSIKKPVMQTDRQPPY